MDNQYTRLEYLFSSDLEKIKKSRVCVVGLGGVGGMAVMSLVRSGIQSIIICDNDIVNITNFNRQVMANINNLGKLKTDCLEEMIKDINPLIDVTKISAKFDQNSLLFDYKFDYLIDAIDDIENKYLLIKECLKRNICFISSMGTAKKLDLTKLQITEIKKTSYDPLAKLIRKKLRDDNINDKINVLSSTEEIKKDIRLGSYMPVTATAGLMLSDYIIKQIIKEA